MAELGGVFVFLCVRPWAPVCSKAGGFGDGADLDGGHALNVCRYDCHGLTSCGSCARGGNAPLSLACLVGLQHTAVPAVLTAPAARVEAAQERSTPLTACRAACAYAHRTPRRFGC